MSPKWLLRRLRLQEVTGTLAAAPGAPVDWAGLAADLGYVDQAHLSRDFTAMVGEPPTCTPPATDGAGAPAQRVRT